MPVKKVFELTPESNLKNLIKSGLLKCAVFFGDEHFMIKRFISNIVSTVEICPDFNVSNFEGEAKMQSVYDAVTAFPMMSDKRVVVLRDFAVDKAPAAETEKLFAAINDMPDTTIFVIWFETVDINIKKPGDKVTALFNEVHNAGGNIFNICRKSSAEIVKLLQSGAAKRKCRLDASVARYIVESCSDDLGTLVNELEKLCFYVGEGGEITVATVDKVCSRSTEASVYNVSKALVSGNLKLANKLVDDLVFMNVDIALILNILSSSYIDMARAFAIKNAGQRIDAYAKQFGYYNNAFRLTDAERTIKKLDENKILKSLECLADCDKKVKGSRADARALLEKAMVELYMIMK